MSRDGTCVLPRLSPVCVVVFVLIADDFTCTCRRSDSPSGLILGLPTLRKRKYGTHRHARAKPAPSKMHIVIMLIHFESNNLFNYTRPGCRAHCANEPG